MGTVETSITNLYQRCYGVNPDEMTKLPVSGSNRSYFLVSDLSGRQVIATVGTDVQENQTFIYLARHFRNIGLPVPQIFDVSDDATVYLQEYIGDQSLYDKLPNNASYSSVTKKLIERCVRVLPHIQFNGSRNMDFSRCYPEESLSRNTISNDISYFKYCFLKPSGIEFDEQSLDKELEYLRDLIYTDSQKADTFMVRDFQSRNIMLKGDNPYVIDFQGGRRGPAQYDLASFLWQAKAAFPTEIKLQMIEAYIDEAVNLNHKFDSGKFRASLPIYVLFRILQTLGAYGFRGWTERKPHFLRSIPNGVKGLSDFFHSPVDEMFAHVASRFPYLSFISSKIISSPKVSDLAELVGLPDFDGLTLTVSSFSYKRGIPYDLSGNGGGYVFDCRGVHNPGRYDEYKPLTGLDRPVIDFLESNGEIVNFLSDCTSLVEKTVERYLSRGFTSLSVSFGCTGGRHRSVYSAESLGNYFAQRYPHIRVVIHHREQQILKELTRTTE